MATLYEHMWRVLVCIWMKMVGGASKELPHEHFLPKLEAMQALGMGHCRSNWCADSLYMDIPIYLWLLISFQGSGRRIEIRDGAPVMFGNITFPFHLKGWKWGIKFALETWKKWGHLLYLDVWNSHTLQMYIGHSNLQRMFTSLIQQWLTKIQESICPISRLSKEKLRGVNWLWQGHTGKKCKYWSYPGCLTLNPRFFLPLGADVNITHYDKIHHFSMREENSLCMLVTFLFFQSYYPSETFHMVSEGQLWI